MVALADSRAEPSCSSPEPLRTAPRWWSTSSGPVVLLNQTKDAVVDLITTGHVCAQKLVVPARHAGARVRVPDGARPEPGVLAFRGFDTDSETFVVWLLDAS